MAVKPHECTHLSSLNILCVTSIELISLVKLECPTPNLQKKLVWLNWLYSTEKKQKQRTREQMNCQVRKENEHPI